MPSSNSTIAVLTVTAGLYVMGGIGYLAYQYKNKNDVKPTASFEEDQQEEEFTPPSKSLSTRRKTQVPPSKGGRKTEIYVRQEQQEQQEEPQQEPQQEQQRQDFFDLLSCSINPDHDFFLDIYNLKYSTPRKRWLSYEFRSILDSLIAVYFLGKILETDNQETIATNQQNIKIIKERFPVEQYNGRKDIAIRAMNQDTHWKSKAGYIFCILVFLWVYSNKKIKDQLPSYFALDKRTRMMKLRQFINGCGNIQMNEYDEIYRTDLPNVLKTFITYVDSKTKADQIFSELKKKDKTFWESWIVGKDEVNNKFRVTLQQLDVQIQINTTALEMARSNYERDRTDANKRTFEDAKKRLDETKKKKNDIEKQLGSENAIKDFFEKNFSPPPKKKIVKR